MIYKEKSCLSFFAKKKKKFINDIVKEQVFK